MNTYAVPKTRKQRYQVDLAFWTTKLAKARTEDDKTFYQLRIDEVEASWKEHIRAAHQDLRARTEGA